MAAPHKKRPDNDELEAMFDRVEAGVDTQEIADQYGVTKSTVNHWLSWYRGEVLGPLGCKLAKQRREERARQFTVEERDRRRRAILSALDVSEPSLADLLSPPRVAKSKAYMDTMAVYG